MKTLSEKVLELRELTNIGLIDCKKALELCDENVAIAKIYLETVSQAVARYKIVDGKPVTWTNADYVEAARMYINKLERDKAIDVIECVCKKHINNCELCPLYNDDPFHPCGMDSLTFSKVNELHKNTIMRIIQRLSMDDNNDEIIQAIEVLQNVCKDNNCDDCLLKRYDGHFVCGIACRQPIFWKSMFLES